MMTVDVSKPPRDIVVLEAVVRYFEQHDDHRPQATDLALMTGRSREAVTRSLRALAPQFLVFEELPRYNGYVTGLTEEGRQAAERSRR